MRYELLDRIGVGGIAEIFRGQAIAAGGFQKPVAIKRILPHLSQDPRFVELLIAEANVLSLLRHRNIVQIFDVGLGDDDQYFLVMEHVDGLGLRAIISGLERARARLPFDLALHVAAELCDALEHAHAARAPSGKPLGLVHRDISPSNVLVSRAGEVKLTDFAIAKRAEQEHTIGSARRQSLYNSPEQARNQPLTAKSDVFSIGIVVWELLANRRFYSGLGDYEAARALAEGKFKAPSEVDRSLPRTADALVMSALAREPSQRPSAGQLGQRLRALRYSLDDASGDPASALAKVLAQAERGQADSGTPTPAAVVAIPRSRPSGFDLADPTVIRIRTADAFSVRDEHSISAALEQIDRFEEAETRMAQLSTEQLAQLRQGGDGDGDGDTTGDRPVVDVVEAEKATLLGKRGLPLAATPARAQPVAPPTLPPPIRRPAGGGFRTEDAPTIAESTPGGMIAAPHDATRPIPNRPPTSRPPVPTPLAPPPAAAATLIPPSQMPTPVHLPSVLAASQVRIASERTLREVTPTVPTSYEPTLPVPKISGRVPRASRLGFRPAWLLVGAVVVAVLAFLVTRLVIRGLIH